MWQWSLHHSHFLKKVLQYFSYVWYKEVIFKKDIVFPNTSSRFGQQLSCCKSSSDHFIHFSLLDLKIAPLDSKQNGVASVHVCWPYNTADWVYRLGVCWCVMCLHLSWDQRCSHSIIGNMQFCEYEVGKGSPVMRWGTSRCLRAHTHVRESPAAVCWWKSNVVCLKVSCLLLPSTPFSLRK